MTTAHLGFTIDTSEVKAASVDLDALSASAAKTEGSVEKIGRSGKKALSEVGAGATQMARNIQEAVDRTQSLNRVFGAQDQHVRAWRDEIDRLTTKFQPLVAAEKQHVAAVNEIQRAHRLNIITSEQMTQHLDRERLAYERLKTSATVAGAAVKAANANVPRAGSGGGGGQNFNAANTMFQFQDIAMTAAMGMNPAMIAMQQGSQLAGGFAGMSAKQALMTTGSALVGMLNPLSLVTIGFTAATAAAIQYFMTSSEGTDKMAVDLERQHDLIGKVAARWGDLAPALKSYADEVERARMAQEDQQAATDASSLKIKSLRSDYDELITIMGRMDRDYSLSNAVNSADTEKVLAFRAGMIGVNEAIAAGKDPTDSLNGALASLTSILGDKANPIIKDFYDALSRAGVKMRETAGEARAIREAFQGFKPLSAPWSEDGRFLYEEAFIPRNPAVPMSRPNIELNGEQDSAIPQQLRRLLSGSTDSANGLNAALGSVSTTLQTVNTGVIDVSHSLAMAKMQQLTALESTTNQVRGMKSELREIKTALEDAAETPLSEIFTRGQKVADDTISGAVAGIEKLMLAMKNTGASAMQTHEGIERIRSRLKQLGGDTKAVDLLVDSLVAGYREVTRLEGGIKSLSASIMNIPNKMVNIGIRQYTVPSSNGGTKGINVYGAGADMTGQQYDVGGGKSVGVYSGNGAAVLPPRGLVYQDEIDSAMSLLGYRAAGGPVDAGGTYLVGEEGPEILKMAGAGHVTNAGNTASILSGGRDALSMIEDHAYDMLAELRIHTDYLETNDADNQTIIACLKKLESVGGSSSYSGGGSSSRSSAYSGSSGSSDSGNNIRDMNSPYYYNAARNNAGRGGGKYDPVADAMLNGNVDALRGVGNGYQNYLRQIEVGGSGAAPSLLDRLKKQLGFATGGQIMAGEDQKVEFFKRRKERVIIVDNDNVSDQRGSAAAAARSERPIQIVNNFHGGNVGNDLSRRAMADQFRSAVRQAMLER